MLPISKNNLQNRIEDRKERIDKDNDFYNKNSLKLADYIVISDKIEEIKSLLLAILR